MLYILKLQITLAPLQRWDDVVDCIFWDHPMKLYSQSDLLVILIDQMHCKKNGQF